MHLAIDFDIGDALGTPCCKILIDDYLVLHEGLAVSAFERHFEISPGPHQLKIVHYGKTDQDHVYNIDGSIGIDKYLLIKSIAIDQVRLEGKELWEGKFWPAYSVSFLQTCSLEGKQPPLYISPNLYLGHNGTWVWDFYYPFLDWIIEQRKPALNLSNTVFRTTEATMLAAKNFFTQAKDI